MGRHNSLPPCRKTHLEKKSVGLHSGHEIATNKDNTHAGYDKEHTAPDTNMPYDSKAMKEYFLFGNILPRKRQFYRIIWKDLEEKW